MILTCFLVFGATITMEFLLRESAYKFSLDYGFWIYFNNQNKFVLPNFSSHIVFLFVNAFAIQPFFTGEIIQEENMLQEERE